MCVYIYTYIYLYMYIYTCTEVALLTLEARCLPVRGIICGHGASLLQI